MKFQYSEKKVKLPENVHAYAEKKVMKLARYFEDDAEALIVFSVEKNRNKAELTVHGAGTWFRASESTSDMFASIDAAIGTIEGQIRKNKTRLARRLRQDAFTRTVEETSFAPEPEEGEIVITKQKHFYMRPMTREEAVLQMELLNHSFFAFRDQDNGGSFAVVYKPQDGELDRGAAQERAEQIAEEWSRAMQEGRNGSVRDFVSVGDVSIKAIGADNQILDSETPVRQILEQLVAKTGLPPFMLGLSWSSTERMSSQQADMLTSEITALRRTLEPVIERVCTLWLRMHGYGCRAVVDWEDINLQDEVEEAKAALYLQQARKLRQENDEAEGK